MKKLSLALLAVVVVAVFLSGCALYGDKAQYDRGDWYFVTGSQEVAKIEQDKLALAKLEAQPVQTAIIDGVKQGYKGLVSNLYTRRVNIHIDGPEEKRYLLAAGQSEEDYLLPGKYIATAYRGNGLVGTWKFEVDVKQVSYMGRKVHWYLYYDP
jgi:hypothetical protein